MTTTFDPRDLQHEEEIQRNPYDIKIWLAYLLAKNGGPAISRYVIYERALKFLPRSYKLWHAYLQERTVALNNHSINDKRYGILINTYERALVNMHKMPRIWLDYTALLMKLKKGTTARRTFNRALQALPITQHKKIWDQFIKWATSFGASETCIRVYNRFLMYDPSHREDFVEYLLGVGEFGEAARQLVVILDDEQFVSASGMTRHQMWMQLCDICAGHPDDVKDSLKVEAIIRSGIATFSDEVGRLWCRLADYYVRQGQFEKARDVYEEALNTVKTVRDFSIVFDSYVKVEESVVTAKMRMMDEDDDSEGQDGAEAKDVELRLARLEYLMDKRPLLLNSVMLRQNPHNVFEWHKRAKLYKEEPNRMLLTYKEGVNTVDPKVATGKLSGLWLAYARFHENRGDADSAREVFAKAIEVNFKSVDELATVWCAWAEMELRLEEFDRALSVMHRAVTEPVSSIKRRKAQAVARGKSKDKDDNDDGNFEGSVCADRVYKHVKVWLMYLDLEESLGTVETCRAAYDRAMELKVITPQMVLNYAAYLEEHNYFEDSFKVYERAVAMFQFPLVKKIWLEYLDKFMNRYGGTKLERLRDLFEQAVAKVPAEDAAEFFIKYAKAEEAHGLARHAIAVYDRAARLVPDASRLDMYRLYIKKVEHYFGVTKTRPVYERAVTELNETHSRAICLEFADMERKLGEIDRARAIFQHGSQFADPRKDPLYWRRWREFEESHGNEDTFRDMLRVQRSVETAYSQVNYLAAEMMAGETLNSEAIAGGRGSGSSAMSLDPMAQQEAALRDSPGQAPAEDAIGHKRKFVPASNAAAPNKLPALGEASNSGGAGRGSANPDEIDIDAEEGDRDGDGGDDEGDEGAGREREPAIKQKPVPLAVFGSAARAEDE